MLLEHNGDPWTIYDAVEVPTPSADDVFIGPCELKGKEMKDSVVAVPGTRDRICSNSAAGEPKSA